MVAELECHALQLFGELRGDVRIERALDFVEERSRDGDVRLDAASVIVMHQCDSGTLPHAPHGSPVFDGPGAEGRGRRP